MPHATILLTTTASLWGPRRRGARAGATLACNVHWTLAGRLRGCQVGELAKACRRPYYWPLFKLRMIQLHILCVTNVLVWKDTPAYLKDSVEAARLVIYQRTQSIRLRIITSNNDPGRMEPTTCTTSSSLTLRVVLRYMHGFRLVAKLRFLKLPVQCSRTRSRQPNSTYQYAYY